VTKRIGRLFLLCCLFNSTLTEGQTLDLQWDLSSAMAAIQTVDIAAAAKEIGDDLSLANSAATLIKIQALENRSDWPLPAREAAIYKFTQSLTALPRAAVAPEIIQHLSSYQARTLVALEDHGAGLIPLFNIRGAAAGVENAWQHAEFAAEAFTLIKTNPAKLVTNYIVSGNQNQRSGYLDALAQTNLADMAEIQDIALERLGTAPVLTSMLALTAAKTADTFAIQQLLLDGRGVGLSPALALANQQLQQPETISLLAFAIQHAPPTNAAQAIAAWWPGIRHKLAARDLMMGLLGDPALGASAALALSLEPDIQTIKALKDIARGDSPAARRAQMALDINHNQLMDGTSP